jgi:peptidoglycan/xylan/chitin deacetylase (PgdA/CDA1 family)
MGGRARVKKLLLLAVLTLLPAAGASAEDKPPVGPQVESQVEPEDKPASCEDALGVSRVAEVDTKGGALFGDQYPPTTLLQKGEVVLTFDDGPHPTYTKQILAALAAQCTKATFFNVGEMVKQFPDIAKQVQAEGHTVGTHTWSHRNLGSLSLDGAKSEIESTITAENAVLPNGVAPFFRFPYLSDPKGVREYLATRNIAVFSTDVDSFDWRTKAPDKIVDNVRKGLIKTDRGIILFHDIHEQTVKALPTVLKELKSHGFKVVHLVPKSQVEVVALAEPPKAEATQGRRAYRHARHGKHRRYAKR